MSSGRPDQSPSIRIDLVAERLWRDGSPHPLRPRTWAVLRYLVERPGALATKDELLDAIWADAIVSEGTLNKSIGELRVALGDDRENPRFIETVPRRGFRWIDLSGASASGAAASSAPDALAMPHASQKNPQSASQQNSQQAPDDGSPSVVGRDAEMATLERCFGRAASGSRQVVFVTGEAGAGKSTLVEAFLARLERNSPGVITAHGQCIQAYGQHEPYRPFLEAAERLARHAEHGASVVATLRSSAPSWLRQLPSLGTSNATASDDDAGMAPARMLREIAAVIEDLCRDRPLVFVLEDAHWADLATNDACNLLARRRDSARFLLIVTLRSTDALVAQHPVLASKGDLVSRGLAVEVPVPLFSPRYVHDYFRERFGGLRIDSELASWMHHQTAGNPLFLRILVDDFVQRGVLSEGADGSWHVRGSLTELKEFVPDSLRDLVERQVDRLSSGERTLIEAASVLSGDFDPSSVAAIAGIPAEEAEEICEMLARRGQVLRRAMRSAAPNDGRFAFLHSLLQRILHDRLPASRMRRLHLAAAARLEGRYPAHEDGLKREGGPAREGSPEREDGVALQMALHYAMAGEPAPALAQLQRAAASVQRIPAPREVIVIREQILDLVERSPGLPGHRRERVIATMDLAQARQLAFAVVDAETKALCERVLELATTQEDGRECFLATMGLFSNCFYTGRYDEARSIGHRLLIAADMLGHPFMAKSAHFAIAGAAYRLGDLDEAHRHFESCLEHEAQSQQTYGWDFHLMSLSHLALVAVHRGQHDEARRLIREAEAHGSRDGAKPDAAAIPLFAFALAMLGDNDDARLRVELALEQSERIGAAAWIERARFVQGLLKSRQGLVAEGISAMQDSLDRQARNNLLIDRSAYCALLSGEMIARGLPEAKAVIDEGMAHMESSGERHFEAELLRLRASLS